MQGPPMENNAKAGTKASKAEDNVDGKEEGEGSACLVRQEVNNKSEKSHTFRVRIRKQNASCHKE